MTPSTVHVVGNRRSGEVLARLRAGGADVVELEASDADATRRVVRSAVDSGASRIVVIGGDGIVHDVVQELAGSPVVLGIVPVGTGNDFARALGLPLDDAAAAAVQALAEPTAVDAIRSSAGWVASIATCGFPATVNERANRLRFPKGSSRYTVATLAVLPSLKPVTYRLSFDGGAEDAPATMIAIANTRYFGGGMMMCPDARANDGLLDVAIVSPLSRQQLLRFLPTVFSGKHRTNPRVRFVRCSSLAVESGSALWADGEPLGAPPVHFQAVPDALQIAGARP